jgi:hypothetical protein
MMSLQAKLKSGKGSNVKKGGKLKNKSMAILDLDNSDDDEDDDGDDGGIMEREKKALEQLQKELNKC